MSFTFAATQSIPTVSQRRISFATSTFVPTESVHRPRPYRPQSTNPASWPPPAPAYARPAGGGRAGRYLEVHPRSRGGAAQGVVNMFTIPRSRRGGLPSRDTRHPKGRGGSSGASPYGARRVSRVLSKSLASRRAP